MEKIPQMEGENLDIELVDIETVSASQTRADEGMLLSLGDDVESERAQTIAEISDIYEETMESELFPYKKPEKCIPKELARDFAISPSRETLIKHLMHKDPATQQKILNAMFKGVYAIVPGVTIVRRDPIDTDIQKFYGINPMFLIELTDLYKRSIYNGNNGTNGNNGEFSSIA